MQMSIAKRLTRAAFIFAFLSTVVIADCTIGDVVAASAPAIISGEFFDLDNPAQCTGSLTGWNLCYYSSSISTAEYTLFLHVWRQQGAAFNRFLNYRITAPATSSSDILTCQYFNLEQAAAVEAGDVFSVFVPSASNTVSVIARGIINRSLYFGGSAQTDRVLNRTLAAVSSTALHVYGDIVGQATTQPPTTGQRVTTGEATTQPPTTGQRVTTGEATTQPPTTGQRVTTGQTTTQPPTTGQRVTTGQATTQPPTTGQRVTTGQATTQPPTSVNSQRTAAVVAVLVLFAVAVIIATVVGILLCIKYKERLMVYFKWNRSGLFGIDNILYRSGSDHIVVNSAQPYDIPTDNHNRSLYNIPKVTDLDGTSAKVPINAKVPKVPCIQEYIYMDHSEQASQMENQQQVADYEPYYSPPTNESDIYQSLTHQQIHTVPANTIEITGFLGKGHFGRVQCGIWKRNILGSLQVAVKKLHENSSQEDKIKFLREAAIMAQFKHPNIVQLHCIVSESEPLMLVLEYLPRGDLRNHLKTISSNKASVSELLSFCLQVAQGVHYLSSKGFVHGDIAARNIFLSMENTCKIGDFGLCLDLSGEGLCMGDRGKVPIKWTAPEVIHLKKYSTASDVWSYGCLLYEIWSLGKKPFKGSSNAQTLEQLQKGYRLHPPPACPQAVYTIMIQCWHPVAATRPSIRDIVSTLLKLGVLQVDSTQGLGGPLEDGKHLYPELQQTYLTNRGDHDYEYVDQEC